MNQDFCRGVCVVGNLLGAVASLVQGGMFSLYIAAGFVVMAALTFYIY